MRVTVVFRDGRRETLYPILSYAESHYTDEAGKHSDWVINGKGKHWRFPKREVRTVQQAHETGTAAPPHGGASREGMNNDAGRKDAEGSES